MSRVVILTSFALRDTFRNWVVLILVVLSLSVGFAAILISASVLEGFNNMLERGEVGWTGHLVISPSENKMRIEDSDLNKIKKELDKIDEIESYSVRSFGVLGIRYEGKFINPSDALGIDENSESATTLLDDNLIEGEFISRLRQNEVVLGLSLADGLEGLSFDDDKIEIGKEIEVVSMNGMSKKYKIRGIIDAKTFLPNWFLIFNKEEIENLDDSRKNSQIVIKLENDKKIDEVKEKIKNKTEDKGLGVTVSTWREYSGYVDDIMAAVSFITLLINRLLNVSVFIIISVIIFINVLQKKRQIGILKSMGAGNGLIIGIYMFETFIYASLSYLLGFLIFFVAYKFSAANPEPLLIGDFYIVFNLKVVLNSLFALLVAALGGGFIPALIASKTKIINVIRQNV